MYYFHFLSPGQDEHQGSFEFDDLLGKGELKHYNDFLRDLERGMTKKVFLRIKCFMKGNKSVSFYGAIINIMSTAKNK